MYWLITCIVRKTVSVSDCNLEKVGPEGFLIMIKFKLLWVHVQMNNFVKNLNFMPLQGSNYIEILFI